MADTIIDDSVVAGHYLREEDKKKFNVIVDAARQGALGLMACTDTASGEYRAVLVVRFNIRDEDGGGVELVPIGHLCESDPYLMYTPAKEVNDPMNEGDNDDVVH